MKQNMFIKIGDLTELVNWLENNTDISSRIEPEFETVREWLKSCGVESDK